MSPLGKKLETGCQKSKVKDRQHYFTTDINEDDLHGSFLKISRGLLKGLIALIFFAFILNNSN